AAPATPAPALGPRGAEAAEAEIDPESEYSPAYAACLDSGDAARGVTPAMAACVHEELSRQDARLNAAYQAAMAARDQPRREGLRAEQRAWIARRDSECREGLSGGTIDRIELPGCHLAMTTVRAVELERMR
ncbi:lysozyme inhibitor LprI family protein, partial [Phenylobacterium sp.]|uniref:lysozyme inhibitor LprI family protein n=1 Tax=Phenylobacterium sp. TaxID=1871053 RepID=UPI0035B141E8